MPSQYIASSWYWLGQPVGQSSAVVYSSTVNRLIPISDTSYIDWLAMGNEPTPWPKDDAGTVTIDALDEVLEAVGIPPTGLATPTKPQLQAAAWATSQTLLSTSRLYMPAGVTMPSGVAGISCDALSSSDNLQGLNIWGMSSPVGTQPWTDNVYNVFTLTGAQGMAFADSVLAYGQSVYAALATVVTAINSGSVTTLPQIASAAWPT